MCSFLFRVLYGVGGRGGRTEATAAAQGPGRDSPWTGCRSTTEPLTPTGAQTGTMWSGQFTSGAHLRDVGETGVPRETPHRHGKNTQAPYRQWPGLGIHFFSLINVITKRRRTKQCFLSARCIYQFLEATISSACLKNE